MIRETIPNEEAGEYYFDEEAGELAIAFFPRYLRHFKGKWAGQEFVLDDWQKNIVRNVFGWKRTKDGTRRYRVVYIWVPRKNGKSTMAAGFALMLLMGDGEAGPEVYVIASTESQARIVYSFVSQMVSLSPDLSSRLTPFKTSIWCDELAGKIEPLTGKAVGKHGLNANGIVGDEIHEWPSDELYTFVHQSEGTREQPMDVLISTAGKRDGTGWEHYQLCEAILEGEIHAPDTYVFIASADAERDQTDAEYWTTEEARREANPGYDHRGESFGDFLKSEVEKAVSNPRKENDVKRYYLNLWVDQDVRWLNMAKWDACGHPTVEPPEALKTLKKVPIIYRKANMRWLDFPEKFKGRRCLAGVDLSATTDLTCTALVFPPDDDYPLWSVVPRFYIPRGSEQDLKDRIKRDKFDYQAAADVGAIILTEGDVVDYDRIREDHLKDEENYELEATGIDRWNALQIATQWEAEGLKVELFGQGFASMTGPSKFLERAVIQKAIDHGGHPVLRWNARNVAVARDPADNIKPVKDKSTGRIDGIVATLIAIGISDDYMVQSVYEERGLV